MIVIEIYSEIDEESSPVEKKEKIKMVLIEKYLKKKNSSLLETQSDENNTQSVDMHFDEITVQDDVDRKIDESKKIQCDKGYINEDFGFNFLSTGLEEIEYLIPGFEKCLTNNKRKRLNTFEVLCMIDKQLENDVDVEPSNNGLPGVVRNDDGKTATTTKNDGQIYKVLSENEKKVAEFIWRACNDGSKLLMQQNLMFISMYSDIVFKSKDLQVQLGIFESLFPNVEVAAGILDILSLVLNHEEKYKENNLGGGNIYCCSRMLTAEIDIIDNLDNDVDDISVRYGELPIYL
ncbi:hypothetical protein Tco_0079763, partial [Tanacetum coccineum]